MKPGDTLKLSRNNGQTWADVQIEGHPSITTFFMRSTSPKGPKKFTMWVDIDAQSTFATSTEPIKIRLVACEALIKPPR